MEIKLTPPLKEFLTLMIRQQVEFLIIGGFAVNFHGYPRLTHDINLFTNPSESNQIRIRKALSSFGFAIEELVMPLFTHEKPIIRFGISPNRVELFSDIPGVTWEECWDKRVKESFFELDLYWIGLAELRKNKAASNRLKDQLDLAELPTL